MRKYLAPILLAATALTALPAAALAEPLKVVATFSIIGDMAKQVGGDRIDLSVLVGPNGDAHVYEPKPQDAARIGEADVVLSNGLKFEGFIDRLVEASGTKAPVVELTKGVTPIPAAEDEHGHAEAGHDDHKHAENEEGHEGEEHAEAGHEGHDHGAFDPHAFQSIPNAIIYVANIADAFCAADAAGCDSYKANAAAYTETLKALDAEVRADVAAVPAEKRTIITSHDAFGYFAKEYGITFLAPEGVSTEAEASAADVAKLIDQVREDKAAAVFVENVTNPRLIEQIAKETGLKVGGALYSDALSPADGPATTYVDLMRHNIRTIAGAVTGS
ncbi:zinc ABC transporter substrate-binding protein AztC [Mesorhizobium australicum]|uniref:Zinc/manganese transport system substrate-binding protein n=1 Tax=Mesorhizobium australicum TaxID=536018 RepID=A0A1X7NIZ3_9HYPH|nr:zinc ABC transporter substrate-binding protein AztC [Mesorhizobium australicum]SMH37795.1 zinc/manganese transport system substrate-binding protein [Mesorhizobium australicum]